MDAKTIQVCGTGSAVGKSVIVSGLCRIFKQEGFKVAPFKAQNMSLNSYVTYEGGEIGRAQALQAQACGLKPSVDMNPILLKPTSDKTSQVILQGKPVGNMSALEYRDYKRIAREKVLDSFNKLKKNFEIIVIEGAGSPAEVNLKSHDLVNMKMAKIAKAPVILVGDIDKGGVFAWLVGTLELLTKEERKIIKGFIINKFRGDKRLLNPGIDFLEKRTNLKVLGVVPYFSAVGGSAYGGKDIRLPEEDSAALEAEVSQATRKVSRVGLIDIAVIKLPHISNFTDFDSLENEPDVNLHYVQDTSRLNGADVIIIPGTKNSIADLRWLKESGIAGRILRSLESHDSTALIGICGGYQMLGMKICDKDHIESKQKNIFGLGLLPIVTNFAKEKTLAQVQAQEISTDLEISGYQIHHGQTKNLKKSKAAFKITQRQGKKVNELDGILSDDDRVWGTYIHGVFDKDAFRRAFLNRIRIKRGLSPIENGAIIDIDRDLDKLAQLLRGNMDMDSLRNILFKGL